MAQVYQPAVIPIPTLSQMPLTLPTTPSTRAHALLMLSTHPTYTCTHTRTWARTAGMLLAFSLIKSLVRKFQQMFNSSVQRIQACKARMQASTSYAEWRAHAEELDALQQETARAEGGHQDELFDGKLLAQKLAHLQGVREHGNVKETMFNLRSDLFRNVANIGKRCGGCCSIWGDGPGRRSVCMMGPGMWAALGEGGGIIAFARLSLCQ